MNYIERLLDSTCDYGEASTHLKTSPQLLDELINRLGLDVPVSAAHRQRALYLLGRWGDPAAVVPIQRILPFLDELGRLAAIDALGRIGTEEALGTVIDHADDPSPDVRRFVVTALRRANTSAARETLQRLAEHDAVGFVRAKAMRALDQGEGSENDPARGQ